MGVLGLPWCSQHAHGPRIELLCHVCDFDEITVFVLFSVRDVHAQLVLNPGRFVLTRKDFSTRQCACNPLPFASTYDDVTCKGTLYWQTHSVCEHAHLKALLSARGACVCPVCVHVRHTAARCFTSLRIEWTTFQWI